MYSLEHLPVAPPADPRTIRRACQFLLLIGTVFLFQSAPAALLIEEAFNYPAGTLVPQASPPWSVGGPLITVESESLTSPPGLREPPITGNRLQLNTNIASQLALRSFPPVTNDSVYISFLLQQTSLATTGGGVLIGLHDGNTTITYAAANASAALGLHVRRWQATTTWQIGIRKGQGTTMPSMTDMFASPVNLGDTAFVVAKYQFNPGSSDTVTLWVNPPADSFGGSTEAIPSVGPVDSGVTADATALRQLFIRAWSTVGGVNQLDNIRVGTSWSDVTPTDATRILSVERLLPDEVKLVWDSTPGKTYVIESRDDLALGDWTTNGTITATESTTAFTNSSIPAELLHRFYRIGRTPEN